MDHFLATWVNPFYLQILHGNYRHSYNVEEQLRFNQQVKAVLPDFSTEIATDLLSRYWREQITGSWFCGIKGYTHLGPVIGELLLTSNTCYAGQGHCFALACFANENSAAYLVRYLTTYLAQKDLYYDQHWAMPALMWLDTQLGTGYAAPFLTTGGLWDQFVADKLKLSAVWELDACKQNFWEVMEYCQVHFATAKG
jgi:hypothetical protein